MGVVDVVLSVFCLSSLAAITVVGQQPYAGLASTDCSRTDNSTSLRGYSCNGLNKTCPTYLIFRSQRPFSTVSAISSLFALNSSLLSSLNSVSPSHAFPPDKQVIVPITCSCSGGYSQVNVTYTVRDGESYFIITSDTFQGLTTCAALMKQNNIPSNSLQAGTRVVVPVRCACPTPKQVRQGVNYLMTYPVAKDDFVSTVSERFNNNTTISLQANKLSENSVIFPSTTILIPLKDPPSSADTADPPPSPVSPPLLPSPPQKKSNKTWVYALVGVLAGIGVLGVVLGLAFFCLFPRKTREKEKGEAVSGTDTVPRSFDHEKLLDDLPSMAESLKVYKFRELRSATADFSPSRLIRGSVYLGTISGDYAAIKKINGDVSEEIKLLSKLNHFNLIRLSGYCFHDGDWYLVYEHAANGSLSELIYLRNESSGKLLSWTQRMRIAQDVATGLNYLHSFTNPPYVHKDINATNILLDKDYRAKIANFRLARSTKGQNGDDFVLTRHIEGTKGYIAPEYLENGLISTKLDVYSFGVLLLEIVTGKEVTELNECNDIWSDSMVEEERYRLLEQFVYLNCPVDLKRFVVRLLRDCLKKDHMSRPSMDEIVPYLSRILTASLNWESSYSQSSGVLSETTSSQERDTGTR